MEIFTFNPFTCFFYYARLYSKKMFVGFHPNLFKAILLLFFLLSSILSIAQSYTFPSFDIGTLTSGTNGESVALTTAGITGDYLFFEITADFVGTGSNPAWSNSIQMELNNGSTVIFKNVATSTSGLMNGASATTLHWTGVLNKKYIGGDNLTIRFFDDYNVDGPYTSSITNITIIIDMTQEAYTFPSFNVGKITSGTYGESVTLNTTGITGDYLFFEVTADFVGTGSDPAWSNSMEMELNNNGTVLLKNPTESTSGFLNNSVATTLHWTGVLNKKYIGGDNLAIRFFDDYILNGPYTSNITNVVVSISKVTPHAFASFDVGTITSGTYGESVTLNTTGITGDYLFFEVAADFVGTGSDPAWSNSMEMELSNNSTVLLKNPTESTSGFLNNSVATTLHWTGVLNKKYIGGDNLAIRFFDDYILNGPYTSSITNVNVNIANLNSASLNIQSVESNTNFTVYPVPFKNEIFVNYSFDYQTDVSIELYDIKGALLKRAVNKNYRSGTQSKTKLDLKALSSQMFFVKLRTNKGVDVRKIINN